MGLLVSGALVDLTAMVAVLALIVAAQADPVGLSEDLDHLPADQTVQVGGQRAESDS